MLPPELTSRPQWLTWRLVDGQKIPNGKSNDPSTWCHFHEIEEFDKIAFVFSENDPFCGVDLDDCILEGEVSDWAQEIMDRFKGFAFAEYSPSGTGIKLIVRAKKPAGSRCSNSKGVECYDHKRFWAITRNTVKGFESIGDGQEQINWLIEKFLKGEPQPVATKQTFSGFSFVPKSLVERAEKYVDNAESPLEGGRNNAAFSLAGHLFAMVQDGARLSKSDVLSMVQRWNDKLPSPMTWKEIESVVESASKNGTPRDDKEGLAIDIDAGVDISGILNQMWASKQQEDADFESDSDEDFCIAMVPPSGLLREVFDFYCESAYRESHVMGLAVAVSLCETIFGRRVRSHTDLRTNDYNLVLAGTGSGKENCESSITKILNAADPSGSMLLAPDIQSGNGLMHAVAGSPCSVWVCDEFGKILQAVLDKKGNQHIKNIGNHLLKLYGKSAGTYGGAAHSNGIRNKVHQPHLVILGLATPSTVFDCVSSENVSDGLLGRIAFWPVQDRPEAKLDLEIVQPSEKLTSQVQGWIQFNPGGGNLSAENPIPETLKMSIDAKARWQEHSKQIDDRMHNESEARAAIWARVAARSMKLSLVARCARMETLPSATCWDFVQIEIQDVNWGIKLANWLAKIACDLVRENTIDKGKAKAKAILLEAVKNGPVNSRELLRAFRGLSAGDLSAAATELGLTIRQDRTPKGRTRVFYESPAE
jgi:hypothetical protein